MFRKLSAILILIFMVSGLISMPASANDSGNDVVIEDTQVAPTWWAWIYDDSSDTLSLMNVNGQQMGIARPKLPNEQAGNITAALTISRDGQYMLINAPLANGNQGLGIYSFASRGFLATYDVGTNRNIRIGGNNSYSGYIEELGTEYVAVTYMHDIYSGALPANTPAWSIVIYELNTGSKVNQLDSNDTNLTALIPSASSEGVFANLVYLDRSLEVHAQILPSAAGVTTYADAFVWDFHVGAINLSPWTAVDIDLLPNPTGLVTQAVFPAQLTNYAILPSNGPYESMNALQIGKPQSTNPAPTEAWVDGTRHHFLPQWVAGGNLILFGTTDSNDTLLWNVMTTGSTHVDPLFNPVMSVVDVPDGFLAQMDNYDIFYYTANTLNNPTRVWTTTSTSEIIVWTPSAGITINYPPGNGVVNNGNNPPGNNNPPPSNNNNGTLISYGETVNNIKNDCAPELYTFQGTSGDIVNIYMTRGSDTIDPYLSFSSPSGTLLGTDDDSYGFPNAWLKDYPLPETGLYEIYASCVTGTGLYYLTLELGASSVPPIGGGAIAYGETKTGTIQDCIQGGDTWVFYGNAGDSIEITMTDTSGLDPYLMLQQDPGIYLTEDDDSAGNLDALITYTLPADSNYLIIASCSGSGSYSLSLNNSVVAPNPPGGDVVIPLNYSDSYSSYKNACNFPDYYSFSGTVGDVVDIYMTATSGTLDPTLALWGPRNQLIAEDDDGNGYPNSLLDDITLPETGTYNINAGCITAEGDYTVELYLISNNGGNNNPPPPAPTATPNPPANNPPPIQNGGFIAYGQTVHGEFAAGSCPNSFSYQFYGAPGDIFNVEMRRTSGDVDPIITIFDPNGMPSSTDDDGLGYPDAALYSVFMLDHGEHQLVAGCLTGGGGFSLSIWLDQ